MFCLSHWSLKLCSGETWGFLEAPQGEDDFNGGQASLQGHGGIADINIITAIGSCRGLLQSISVYRRQQQWGITDKVSILHELNAQPRTCSRIMCGKCAAIALNKLAHQFHTDQALPSQLAARSLVVSSLDGWPRTGETQAQIPTWPWSLRDDFGHPSQLNLPHI